MMDHGFGTNSFGEGTFGVADLPRMAYWELAVPRRVKDEDPGDLESFSDALIGLVSDSLSQINDLPDQRDPVNAISGLEESIYLSVEGSERISSSNLRVYISSEDSDKIKKVFPRTENIDGSNKNDGWQVRNEPFYYYLINVDSYELFVDVNTNLGIDDLVDKHDRLEVRPPDMLVRLGEDLGVVVDRQDPPDYTRRATYRNSLLKSLKVSERLFELVGGIYGFELSVDRLFCVEGEPKSIIDDVLPYELFEFFTEGEYYTTVEPLSHYFDGEYIDIESAKGSIEIDPEVNNIGNSNVDGVSYWRLFLDKDNLEEIKDDDRWRLVDSHGNNYWVEEVSIDNGSIAVYAPDDINFSEAYLEYFPEVICREDWKLAPAYHFELTPGEVLDEPHASLSRLLDRIESKIEYYLPIKIRFASIDYNIGGDIDILSAINGYYASIGDHLNAEDQSMFGDRYDIVPADETTTDHGVLKPYAEFTIDD